MSRVVFLVLACLGAVADKAFPFLPPGVQSGIQSAKDDADAVTLVMHPPQEDALDAKNSVDAVLAGEKLYQRAVASDFVAAKQRALNAEIAKIHQMIQGRRSFLKADDVYEVNLHVPEQTAAEMSAGIRDLAGGEAANSAA